MNKRSVIAWLCPWLVLFAVGCFKADEVNVLDPPTAGRPSSDAGSGGGSRPPMTAAGRGGEAGGIGPIPPPNRGIGGGAGQVGFDRTTCVNGGSCEAIDTDAIDALDLLFVVDNSGSMREEQALLRAQFPKLIDQLVRGQTSAGEHFAGVKDLHLGVVSTDMGLAGIPNRFPGCNTPRHVEGGDDGVLQHPGGTGPGCASTYPAFLEYQEGVTDPAQVASDFGCIATLGTEGCGFEQQLEAGLKALWPKNYVDGDGNVYPPERNPILFLSATQEGQYGRGDRPLSQGGNAGFLRNDPVTGRSLVAVIIVTDEEDCSSKNTSHFVSTNDPSDPLSHQGINLRCFYNQQNLFDVDRYMKGFHGLRPGREDMVIFGAIAGVPPDLVDTTETQGVDFADRAQRDEYYDAILRDVRMEYRPIMEENPQLANLEPSCEKMEVGGSVSRAYPPRRIVQVAKGFGENSFVHSICSDDYSPATDRLVQLVRKRVTPRCLPQALRRNAEGKVSCEVIWQLPTPGTAPQSTPTSCDAAPYMQPVGAKYPRTNARGGVNCAIHQLAVVGQEHAPGEGFYYDDWSAALCGEPTPQRIAFTEDAKPAAGVKVVLDCPGSATQ